MPVLPAVFVRLVRSVNVARRTRPSRLLAPRVSLTRTEVVPGALRFLEPRPTTT
jgi:hypothetical protein